MQTALTLRQHKEDCRVFDGHSAVIVTPTYGSTNPAIGGPTFASCGDCRPPGRLYAALSQCTRWTVSAPPVSLSFEQRTSARLS